MESILKKSKYALYLIVFIGIVLLIKFAFIICDLVVLKTPIFYTTTPCTDLRRAVLITALVSSLINGLASMRLFSVLNAIIQSAKWSRNSSKSIRWIAFLLVVGTYCSSLAAYTGNTYLVNKIAVCPPFINILFSSYANGYALGKALFIQGPLIGCLFFVSLFLEYVYSIKKENEFFI
ncbi:hypothetical protein A8C56_21845 [Niabella ginsenosidivorans]|uniref:DUF2975 domain-containing protein n=1 Tax=Niabella ginsenosidivorans TaxID=1176587 RepID=A0A1A9I976_9BACT|nr:hypothetical protein A8C56_21845 [Niabella ginsenosidivorans]